eukprot:Em0018g154a
MNALYAAACIFFGGVLGATVDSYSTNDIFPVSGGAVTRWMAIVIGLFVFFIEYPRSARRNQKTNVERPGQRYIAPIIQYTFIFRIYIIRVLIYIVARVAIRSYEQTVRPYLVVWDAELVFQLPLGRAPHPHVALFLQFARMIQWVTATRVREALRKRYLRSGPLLQEQLSLRVEQKYTEGAVKHASSDVGI